MNLAGFYPAILLAAVLLAPGSPARAAFFEEGKWEFDYNQGYAIPVSNSSFKHRKSTHLKGSALYKVNEWFVWGVEMGYSTGYKLKGRLRGLDFDTPRDGVDDDIGFDTDAKRFMLNFNPVMRLGRWLKFETAVIRPYAMLGAGMYHSWIKPGKLTLNGISSSGALLTGTVLTQDSKERTTFGINLGFGMDQQINERFSVGADLRYHHIFNATDSNSDGSDDGPFEIVVPSLKLTYHF